MPIPTTYQANDGRAEAVLLDAARAHAVDPDSTASDAKANLKERFGVEPIDLNPHVYYRITDNWLELTVCFIVHTHWIRSAKDAMARQINREFRTAGIGIASATFDIVGLPPIELRSGQEQKTKASPSETQG